MKRFDQVRVSYGIQLKAKAAIGLAVAVCGEL